MPGAGTPPDGRVRRSTVAIRRPTVLEDFLSSGLKLIRGAADTGPEQSFPECPGWGPGPRAQKRGARGHHADEHHSEPEGSGAADRPCLTSPALQCNSSGRGASMKMLKAAGTLAVLALAAFPGAAMAHTGKATLSCAGVQFDYALFPAGSNTVHYKIVVDNGAPQTGDFVL